MSFNAIRNSLLTPLYDALDNETITSISEDEVAFDESQAFDPTDKLQWVAVYILPADSISLGQGSSASDEERGILQISVFVKRDQINADIQQQDMIDDILSLYKPETSAAYVSTEVHFENHSISAGRNDGAWYARNILINYFSYIRR